MADYGVQIPAQVSAGSETKVTQINEALDALSPAAFGGRDAANCEGLDWGYFGGRWGSSVIDSDVVTVADDDITYQVVELATGAISFDTDDTDWNDDTNYGRQYLITAASGAITDWEDHRQCYGGGAGGAEEDYVQIAVGDLVTPITSGTTKAYLRMPFALTLTDVRASLLVAQASGSIFTVDVNEGGSSVLSTKITIDNTEKTSTTAATAPVISDAALADDAEITIDVDQIGDGTAIGLIVTLIGTR